MNLHLHKHHNQPWLWRYRFSFTIAATLSTACLYFLLYGIGFVPQTFQYRSAQSAQAQTATTTATKPNIDSLESTPARPKHELPKEVTIPSVGIDTEINNPASRQIGILNSYLDRGAVRYPQSGHPGNGNLFLFGHSTSHDTVWNQAYKTFNGLEDVSVGEKIIVRTDTGNYHYRITSREIKENSDAYVPLEVDKDMLTISTCDSFGSKEDRVVVQADFTKYVASGR
jgi:LPXTG-site transpeptidase (sortase) family protein